jgi:hypothetical protein
MRRLATALLVATTLQPAGARAAEFAWPGRGTVRMTVPAGWNVKPIDSEKGIEFRASPRTDRAFAQFTLLPLPPGDELSAAEVRKELERLVKPYVAGSVEKKFAPKPLPVSRGSGWFVQLTDASRVGKPHDPDYSKMMRTGLAALGDGVLMATTVAFDDPAWPEVTEAMSLLASVRVEAKGDGSAAAPGPFEFTVPQSRVTVKVPDLGLRPDEPPDVKRRYFKLSRENPQLILSGWLEPASAYKGLKDFWESERRSPAYAGAGAPTRVELTKVGAWEVVAFDVVVPGGTSAHVRAERVQAGTWIDLHLSSTGARAPATLREELVTALRSIEVVEK